jgi:crotonobetaine/carnitine-CoA ligase
MTAFMSASLQLDLTDHQQSLLGGTMPDALDAAADAWGDRLALKEVEGARRELTWGELREQVSALRSGLENAGLRAGEKVGILLRNQIEFPVAWFAVVEAGAAVVPLNPKYTTREVDFVLSDAGATWLLGMSDLIDTHVTECAEYRIPPSQVVAVGANTDRPGLRYEGLVQTAPAPRRHQARPTDVTNIQFTSGTTGLPKGCLLTHEYWVELGVYGAALYHGPQRLLADHPFYYMQNQAYLMTAITGGGALYITPGLSRRKFLGWLHDLRIDFAWIDEGMLNFPPSERDSRLPLELAPVSGIPRSLHHALEERFGLKVREWYASTEVASGTAVPADRDDLVGSGSMGFCLPNRESKIIDSQFHEVPDGELGELCLRGSGMMLGYHNRPETNAELFLEGGWFRTGDIVRRTADGQHLYEGRMRDMVRRSGENIASAEVELQISTLPEVDEVSSHPRTRTPRSIVRLWTSGIAVSAVEHPEIWTPERQLDALESLMRSLALPRAVTAAARL